MFKKTLWFLAFVATGVGLLLLSLSNSSIKSEQIFLILTGIFFVIGLTGHYKEIQGRRK